MADTMIVATEKVKIMIDESFGQKPIIVNVNIPDHPQMLDSGRIELKQLSYSAKRVADKCYCIITNSFDFEEPDTSPGSGFEVYIALAGLACEVYFKAILFHEKGITAGQRKIHDLSKLFRMVENKRCDIAEEIIKYVANNDRDYFKKELERSKNIFNEFRYSYELNGYTLNTSFITRLLASLKNITEKLLCNE